MSTYYLVIEYRPNDFMPIDINIILNNNKNYQTIEAIDEFTKKYSEKEIFDLIKEANIVPEKYYSGSLDVINDKKYRFGLISRECKLDLGVFFNDNIKDKNVMNKVVNVYLKYKALNIDDFKNALKIFDLQKTLSILFSNDYLVVRNIYMYIYNNLVEK